MAPSKPPDKLQPVDPDEAGERLDRWLAGRRPEFTRSRWKALVKDGCVSRDGVATDDPSWKVRPGEVYAAAIPEVAPAAPLPEAIPLDVLYEDRHLIVINKPPGLVVHPAAGNWTGTLVNALLAHCGEELSGVGGVARPGVVHRLDKDTSGVLVAAKTDPAHQGLSRLFAAHDIERVYEAAVHGAPRPGVGRVDFPIARAQGDRKRMAALKNGAREGKPAVTHYRTLEALGRNRAALAGDAVAARVECRLETGRTHQIRVHLAAIGHPVIGDPIYAPRRAAGGGLPGLKVSDRPAEDAAAAARAFTRQALHARVLGFRHPITDEMLQFEAEPPADYASLIDRLRAL